LQIAAKQLQIATWLPLTTYRNLPTPYPTGINADPVGSVSLSHNR